MVEPIVINLACKRITSLVPAYESRGIYYSPGEIIAPEGDFMRGLGTYPDNGYLKASVAGIAEQTSRLMCVRPLKARYIGEKGDVVVGRITELSQKRWKVDTNARMDSNLLLTSVNLPGGELRRRSTEDEQMMRSYLTEGDLISAEVHSIYSDGSLSLQTRNFLYGKLSQGVLVKVWPSLVKRCKSHFHNLPFGISIILGSNGFIWISLPSKGDCTGYAQDLDTEVSKSDRESISRVRNCILALAANKVQVFETSIIFSFEESKKYTVTDLLTPEVMYDVAASTQQRLMIID